jgi:hypothetical protein
MNASAQPEYVPPSRLIKCPFDSKQQLIWLETSEWFRAHYRFNKAAKFDDGLNEMRENYEALKKAVPEKYQHDVWLVAQSVFQAFNIVQCKGLGVDTKGFPRGGNDEGTHNWEEQKKKRALHSLKRGFTLWSSLVEPGLLQAIRENGIAFFRRDLPETLSKNRRMVSCFDPDEPARGILDHWLVSFWCSGDYWPSWADPNLPPLCLFTDEAAAEFLSSGNDHPVKTTTAAVRKCRQRLGLEHLTKSKRIKKVVSKNGCFLFSS